jgi:serine/threonine protein kinase
MLADKVLAGIDGFKVLREIGKGGDARIMLVQEKSGSSRTAALKLPLKPSSSRNLIREAEILRVLSHPHIEQCLGLGPHGSFALYEFNEQQDLLERLMAAKRFPEPVARFYFLHLVDTLAFLHLQGIVHRDVKLENLMLSRSFDLKVIDFGFATRFADSFSMFGSEGSQESCLRTEVLGTAGYQPPEMLFSRSGYHPTHHDFFAAGVVLFALVVGAFPFEEATRSNPLYRFYILGNFQSYWQVFQKNMDGVSPQFKDFIENILAFDPRRRLNTLEKIRSHPWCFGETASPEAVSLFMKSNPIV